MTRTYLFFLLISMEMLFSVAEDLMNCTLCVDPLATPLDPDAQFSTGNETVTCQDAHDRGNWTLPEENCTTLQIFGRDLCLCRSDEPPDQDLVNCTLCVDPLASPNDPTGRFMTGTGETLTCQDAHDRGNWTLPQENCTVLQNYGRDICLCESEPATPNDCTLCEDGSTSFRPLFEGLPGETCAELQNDARWDDASNCYAWQGTVGVYCGCENNIVSDALACRLCGEDTLLPEPLDAQDGGPSCGKLEFNASLPGENCTAYQEEYALYCCRNVPDAPEEPTSSGVTLANSVLIISSFASTVVVLMA